MYIYFLPFGSPRNATGSKEIIPPGFSSRTLPRLKLFMIKKLSLLEIAYIKQNISGC